MQINVLEQFNRTCDRWPHKTAVVDRDGSWTFNMLRQRACSIAREIAKHTPVTNTPIAVYLPKTRDAVAAILGALYTGNCYAPLDTKAPLSRFEAILETLKPTLILTTRTLAQSISSLNGASTRIVVLDEVDDAALECPQRWRESIDTDPIYIIHTSGSTGRPKGVVISHRSVIDYIEWARGCFKIDETCVIGNQAPLIFDNSTLDLYLCFTCGATLHLIEEELFLFPLRLLEYLAKHSVNFLFWVPSIMVMVSSKDYLFRVKELALTKILFAGEVMPAKQLNVWRSRFPEAVFANLYGPTEITVDCTYYIVNRTLGDEEAVPIGRACRNTGILILNGENQLCKPGERGELCVRGTSLAHGYWNDPVQTGTAFVQNPLNPHYPETIYRTGDVVYENENGEIIFVGRKDFQIKHLGYRIELGDIESSALKVDGIRNACVLYHQTKKEIVLVYEAEAEISPAVIRGEFGKNLPKYMWPTSFCRLPELPRNPNGKIDRQLLAREFVK